MHYGDIGQEEANIIKIVVYQHEIWDDFKPTGKGDSLEIKSIQSCQFIRPYLVQRLIQYPGDYISTDELRFDRFYLLALKQIDYNNLKVVSMIDVTKSENEYHRLH